MRFFERNAKVQRRRTQSVVQSLDTRSPEAKVRQEEAKKNFLFGLTVLFLFVAEISMGSRAMLSVSVASSDEQVFRAA